MPSDFIAPVEVLPSFTDVIANSGLNSNIPILIKVTLEFAEIPSSVATS